MTTRAVIRGEGVGDGIEGVAKGVVELRGVATAGLGEAGLAAPPAAALLAAAEDLASLEMPEFLNGVVEESDETDVLTVGAAEDDGGAVAESSGEVLGGHLERGGIDALETGDEHLGLADLFRLGDQGAGLGDG